MKHLIKTVTLVSLRKFPEMITELKTREDLVINPISMAANQAWSVVVAIRAIQEQQK